MILNVIKKLRTEKRMPRKEVAEKVGVSETALQMWEIGTYAPSTENFVKLAEVLEVDFMELHKQYRDDLKK
jgi:transcriptional regulator with XRE-family HTH domain